MAEVAMIRSRGMSAVQLPRKYGRDEFAPTYTWW
jgi:hypothetical protein